MNAMNMPGFTAEASLDASAGAYRRTVEFGGSTITEVIPAADDICGNCETIGQFGSITGVGSRSCCRRVWKYDPITKHYAPTFECWLERCTADPVRNRWLSF